jgi:hypothetical protein
MSTSDLSALVSRHRNYFRTGATRSGMGKYHGEWGFRAYTNARGVLYHSTQVDLDDRYPPYGRKEQSRESAESRLVAAVRYPA